MSNTSTEGSGKGEGLLRHRLGAAALVVAAVAILAVAVFRPGGGGAGGGDGLTLLYPFDGSVFPPEIIAPTLFWQDGDPQAERWRVTVSFADGEEDVVAEVDSKAWLPGDVLWETMKDRSLERPATVTVERIQPFWKGLMGSGKASASFATSRDSVGAPIFYRDVPLPFRFALRNVPMIRWRLGSVDSHEQPPVVLENLPVCGNCHSFSRDGRFLGMDVDLGSDKGAYALTSFEDPTELTRDKLITWSEYVRGDSVATFGFLPRVSPDGKYVLAGVKDRVVFLPREDILFSQIFFPVMGILAYFDRETGEIHELPGADSEDLVQTNAVWTPDGETVIFARAEAAEFEPTSEDIILTLDESAQVLGGEEHLWTAQEGGRPFRFDLYRMPFNGGEGGEPEPIPGASNNGMSNYFPKVSPDGKWLVFTQAHSYMLLQPDSKLWIMPVEGGEPRLMHANTSRMNSWHSWSPNSRWLAFASKEFGPYTQIMLAHVDENGMDSPPVMLSNFLAENRAANIPEFVNLPPDAKRPIEERFVDDYSYFRSGRIYQQFQEFDRAEEEFQKSLAMNPANTFSLHSLATIHREQADYEAARREYLDVLAVDPDAVPVHVELGSLCFDLGELAEAESEFLTALELDPGNFQARFNLGTVYLAQDRLDEARASFRRLEAMELDEEAARSVRERLATLAAMQGDYAEATGEWEALVAADPSDPEAHYNLALAYLSRDRANDARQELETVLRLAPEDVQALLRLGEVHAGMGDAGTALDYFQRAVDLDDRNLEALRQVARLHLSTGDIRGAQSALVRVLDVDPTNAWANWSLGMVYYETGQFGSAVQQFQAYADRNPQDPRAWFVLGDALVRKGDAVDQAIQAFQRGLMLDSTDLNAHVALGDLFMSEGDQRSALGEFEVALPLAQRTAGAEALVTELQSRVADLRRLLGGGG